MLSIIFPIAAVLTPQAAADYTYRMEAQPQVAAEMKIPADAGPQEADAMKFLYAYMATPDILDYNGEYYLRNVRAALKAREEMPWGKSVPDREWRHFVLPVRVNNENLDLSREEFYKELKPRVEGMSMKDAILEVNHWCHEKVSYQPSDGRTSSPLATVANALGRCGEESTFTVAALRSIGIPARQVYTPRWAHTDDNHAWVEAWADGEWYFLGACEPEAILNLAWFNEPASRGLLMNTNVWGRYDGPEEQLASNPVYTTINVTSNYAPVDKSRVVVTDRDGQPVKDAEVRYSIYNYAEFYPIAVKKTDSRGYAELTSGKGDMMVWATDGERFGFAKSVAAPDTLRLVLDKDSRYSGTMDFDLVPPAAGAILPKPTPEQAAENDRRKAYEDSIRHAYEDTFMSMEEAEEICRRHGFDLKAATLIHKSRANHELIVSFLENIPEALRPRAILLLENVSDKDLHDIDPDVLVDNLMTDYGQAEQDALFGEYVLNPRVENEMLTPYKQFFLETFTPEEIEEYREDPSALERRMGGSIVLEDTYNPSRYRQSPASTWHYGVADRRSRSIAFVSACRSLGIPARIDPVSGETQYHRAGKWHDVKFGEILRDGKEEKKGQLKIDNRSKDLGREPKYYSQFTFSQIEGGKPRLMEFDEFEPVSAINDRKEMLAPGQYLLVTGQRIADGSVLARTEVFRVEPGREARPQLTVRQDTSALQVIGNLDAEMMYTPLYSRDQRQSILSAMGRGYYGLLIVRPGHEPSSHALNDIAAAASELEATGRRLLVLLPDEDSASRFREGDYGRLPDNVDLGIDDGTIFEAIKSGLELKDPEYPLAIVADSFNRIIYANTGYTIHLGSRLEDVLRRAK